MNNQNSIIISIAVSTLAIIWSIYYFTQNHSNSEILINKVAEKIESIESEKIWWKENYELIKQIYSSEWFKNQQKQSLQSALSQLWWQGANTATWITPSWTTSSLDPNFKEWTLWKDKIEELKKNTYISWNISSKILLLEYSDVECPYCKRFHQAWTVNSLVGKYKDVLSYALNHFPLEFHPNAQKWAEALECVWEIWGKEKFFEFSDKVFALSDKPTLEVLETLAKDLKIDTNKLKQCIESWKYASKVKKQMSEWQTLFGVQWTPWNVLINTETGKWVLIPWAYPASEIEKVISYVSK